MKRRPIDHASSGSVKLPIYFSPLKKKVTGGSNGGSDAAVPEAAKVTTYDSYVLYFYENGVRKKRRFPTQKVAKSKGNTLAKRLAEEGNQDIELSRAERRIYVQARSILAPHGLDVDAGARLLHDLMARLKGASLSQAVNFFNSHGQPVILDARTEEAYGAYMADMEKRGVGEHHKRDVRKFVGGFITALPLCLRGVKTSEINKWLGKLGGKSRNKNNARDKVIAFFNFLEKKNYLPTGGAAVAKCTTAFNDPRPVITNEEEAAASALSTDVYTPEEMQRILSKADPDARVTLELKAFSGIRTEELSRLWWILVKEQERHINITDAIAKVNQRTVPILENLKLRLAGYPQAMKCDKVSKDWCSSNALYHVWKRITDAAGVPYKRNGFRNSYISYRLALTKDINQVAYESGNSPEMIRKFYLDLVTPEQAKAWFAI